MNAMTIRLANQKKKKIQQWELKNFHTAVRKIMNW